MNPVAWREDLCSGSAVCKHDSSEMGLPASPSLGTASQCACRTFWLWSQYLNLALRTGAKGKKKIISGSTVSGSNTSKASTGARCREAAVMLLQLNVRGGQLVTGALFRVAAPIVFM